LILPGGPCAGRLGGESWVANGGSAAGDLVEAFDHAGDRATADDRAKAVNAAAGGGIDDVIDPADTRDWIASGLKRLPPTPARTTKKYPYIDPW
jgi:acetyl-CoA carboxylase carboxyltransferase component